MACDLPRPCKFSSLACCQKSFLRAHKEVDPNPHPVISLLLQVGEMEKFFQALGFENLDPFLRISKQGPCLTGIQEDGGDKRLV